jgi:hypothetical protein
VPFEVRSDLDRISIARPREVDAGDRVGDARPDVLTCRDVRAVSVAG